MHCNGEHEATFNGCEERTRQKNIKFLMAKNNIGYFEALDLHPTYTRNSFAMLENADEFPTLERRTYAAATKITPRSRAVYREKQKKTKDWNRVPAQKTQLLVAAPQGNPLGGPSLNFINPHKTTEEEKITDEFEIFQQKFNESSRLPNQNSINDAYQIENIECTNTNLHTRQDSENWTDMNTSSMSTDSSY